MIDVDALARSLIAAQQQRTAIEPLTNNAPDLDAATAYTVQDAVVSARIKGGAVVVGAKLGLTSKAKQHQMNVNEPLYGWLTDDMQVDTGETVICGNYIHTQHHPRARIPTT